MAGRLYLIPTLIAESDLSLVVPSGVSQVVGGLRHFVVEEESTAQRFLKKIRKDFPFDQCRFWELNEHTPAVEVKKIFAEVRSGDVGLLSEAGVPCVADSGANLVWLAQEAGMSVIPLAGASAIILALMASGLNGQNFAFNGYLPKEKDARVKKVKLLEQRSLQEGQTQLFMETPYRNDPLFKELLEICDPRTLLCVALDLTGPDQMVRTQGVRQWRAGNFACPKVPALFLIQLTR